MITVLGLFAGVLTTGAWLPQLLRTWRRGRADDISYGYLGVFGVGVLIWLVYGLLGRQPAMIATNAVTLVLVGGLLRLKLRPRRGLR
jgi:MtN3 and saliva related transmembrane protein